MIAFISGHVDLSPQEFSKHYHSHIDDAINAKHQFVVGSARGADSFALDYLIQKGVSPASITIYLYDKNVDVSKMLREKYHQLGVIVVEGFSSYTSRDAAMTQASNYDIAWVRPESEARLLYGDSYKPRISGTQKNLDRRKKSTSK